MKHLIVNSLVVSLSLILVGSRHAPPRNYLAKPLKIDERYIREIRFDTIGFTIPILQSDTYVRIDRSVSDMDEHRQKIFEELGILSANIFSSNAAESPNGQHMHLTFADGKQCSFMWVLKSPDERMARAVEEHEKYHALCRISASGISDLSNAIKQRGFDINLEEYDEELSATIIQTLSIHLQGVPFEHMHGSETGNKAIQILMKSRLNSHLVKNEEK